MKTPDSPRAYPAPSADPPSGEGREDKIVPRYVQAPALREHGLGPRNLFWGTAMLVLALILLVVAVFLAGAKAMLYIATCLVTFTALFVLARLHIFRQRNGGFVALALVCLIGTTIPLVERAFSAAKGLVGARGGAVSPTVTVHADEAEEPLLTQAFALSKPEGDGKQVRVLHDSPVVIDGKHFLIKTGDRFPYLASKGEEVTFAVRDLQIALPAGVVEIIDPTVLARGVSANAPAPAATAAKSATKSKAVTDAELAEITRSAQQEAMRRYPALAVKDSLENALFVSTYKQLQDAGNAEFFSNPEWPMALADLLAKHEGWVVGAAPATTASPATTGPAPILDGPEPAPPVALPVDRPPAARQPTNLPPIDSLDAGSGLPFGNRPAR